MKLETKLKIKFAISFPLAIASTIAAFYFYFIMEVTPFIFVGLGGIFWYAAIESFIFITKGIPDTIKDPEKW